MSDENLVRNGLDDLVGVMLDISGLEERPARDFLLSDARKALRRPLDPARSDDPRADLAMLVEAIARYSGGLSTLARIVRLRHEGPAVDRFAQQVDDFVGPHLLSSTDRVAIEDVLAEIPIMSIAGAMDALGNVPALRSLQAWQDLSGAIRAMERLPRGGGQPPLLRFVARLTELADVTDAARLREWLTLVGPGFSDDPRGGPRRVSLPRGEQLRRHRVGESGLIWGNVPGRNRHFTGRKELLDQLVKAVRQDTTTSVLPRALQGLGGVGKTQLVIEFVYRHLDEYDLVWWVPAEQTATVLTSLAELAKRLGLPADEDSQEIARTVLATLAESDLEWLLVYDNADKPETLRPLMPSTGGHVVVTTRNQDWSGEGPSLEVDVFTRQESIAMLTNRTREGAEEGITAAEAHELAGRLGDLPLALEQAAAWYLATRMPVTEYISLLDSHTKELLNEGKPANYPLSIPAFVSVALSELESLPIEDVPASRGVAAQMFGLFAYLGGEPVPVSLFRAGSRAEIAEPLRTVLSSSIWTNRTVRLLSQYGLAKVDAKQRIQVHRLVQLVLRDTLTEQQRAETLSNVRNMLGAANPGDPDEEGVNPLHAEIGPHIEPADMIHGDSYAVRQAVLDHSRYLFIIGDYENCRYLAGLAATVWREGTSDPTLGSDGEQTLQAQAQLANATRTLGDSKTAAEIMEDTYARQQRSLGPMHELTLINGNQIGQDLRIAGRYQEALTFDADNVSKHLQKFQAGHTYTLRVQANLAVDHRMIGQFSNALDLDRGIAEHWENAGAVDLRALKVYMNVARSYFGMGAYRVALEWLDRWRPMLQDRSSPSHGHVLLAGRTYAVTLRKLGRLLDAREVMRDNYERTLKRFGPNHEFSVAATASFGNLLRETGDLDAALDLIMKAVTRYRSDFGESHPLTLVTQVNEAIVRRARNEFTEARQLNNKVFLALTRVLTAEHPYTLSAGTSLATDLSRVGEHEKALELSRRVAAAAETALRGGDTERDGAAHPFRLVTAFNMAHDLRAIGDAAGAEQLAEAALTGLRTVLGNSHPDVEAAADGARLDYDIEPPPT
jgi:tetratricopeptide (TPR) repeat protein